MCEVVNVTASNSRNTSGSELFASELSFWQLCIQKSFTCGEFSQDTPTDNPQMKKLRACVDSTVITAQPTAPMYCIQ